MDEITRPVGASMSSTTERRLPAWPVDDVVVGAGLVGLLTALLLLRRGRRVLVVSQHPVGVSASAASAGAVSIVQGCRLAELEKAHPQRLAEAYVAANADGAILVRDLAEQLGVAVDAAEEEVDAAPALADAVARLGAAVGIRTRRIAGGVLVGGQAVVDPEALLAALAAEIERVGGTVLADVRATGVRPTAGAVVLHTSLGDVQAAHAVLATGTPFVDRGLTAVKTRAVRRHAVEFDVDGGPAAIRTWADVPGLGAVTVTRGRRGGRWVCVVVGAAHHPGREPEAALRARLTAWAQVELGLADPVRSWSAQDYRSHDEIPFVGRLPRGLGRVWFATGFGGWGMANAGAAALRIVTEVTGLERSEWMRVIGSRMTVPADVAEGGAAALEQVRSAASGWKSALAASGGSPYRPPEGTGRVVSSRGRPIAVATIGGRSTALRAICPHCGAVVAFNDVERTWDCPVHGSRYDLTGVHLEGPGTADLLRWR